MLEPARKLGPYRLVSKIGVGGFGVVWLAEKRTAIATTQFALKLSRGEAIDSPDILIGSIQFAFRPMGKSWRAVAPMK